MNKLYALPFLISMICVTACVEPPPSTPIDTQMDAGIDMMADVSVSPPDSSTMDMGDEQKDTGPMRESCEQEDFPSCRQNNNGFSLLTCEGGFVEETACGMYQLCGDIDGSGLSCYNEPSCIETSQGTDCERQYIAPEDDIKGYFYGRDILLSEDELSLFITAPAAQYLQDLTQINPSVYRLTRTNKSEPFSFEANLASEEKSYDNAWGYSIATNEDGSSLLLCVPLHRDGPVDGSGRPVGECRLEFFDETEPIIITNPTDDVFYFGTSAQMSPDGQWLIIGSGERGSSGKIFVYHISDLTAPELVLDEGDFLLEQESSFGARTSVEWNESDDVSGTYNAELMISSFLNDPGRVVIANVMLGADGDASMEINVDQQPFVPRDQSDTEAIRTLGHSLAHDPTSNRIAVTAINAWSSASRESNTNNGAVVIYNSGNGNGLTSPDIIYYPDQDEEARTANFGSAVHFDERGWLWIGAQFHGRKLLRGEDGPTVARTPEGRVYIYRYNRSARSWDIIGRLDGMRDSNTGPGNFADHLGSDIVTFTQDGRVKAAVGGMNANRKHPGQGQVTLFDLGSVGALNDLEAKLSAAE